MYIKRLMKNEAMNLKKNNKYQTKKRIGQWKKRENAVIMLYSQKYKKYFLLNSFIYALYTPISALPILHVVRYADPSPIPSLFSFVKWEPSSEY